MAFPVKCHLLELSVGRTAADTADIATAGFSGNATVIIRCIEGWTIILACRSCQFLDAAFFCRQFDQLIQRIFKRRIVSQLWKIKQVARSQRH